MARYISDTETDGLLPEVSVIHCAVIKDIDTGEARGFRPHEIDEYVRILEGAEEVWFHNAVGFDFQVIKKLYPNTTLQQSKVKDTIVLSRLVYPDIKESDFKRNELWREYDKYLQASIKHEAETGTPARKWHGDIPRLFLPKMIGSHSLEAWGCRVGNHKGDYSAGWEHFSEEMFDYMMQDAEVTWELHRRLMAKNPSPLALELEHRIAYLCWQIEQNGFPFDIEEAAKFYATLSNEREQVRQELIGLFPNWQVRLPDFIPKRNNKTQGYIAGVPVERWKTFEFNPASRDHIEDRLRDKYKWTPKDFTDGGKATIDDDVLSSLPYPEAKKLARFFLLDKRCSQLAEGNQAWMKLCTDEGKIHARYTTNGAATGRATHSKPNISAVPRVSSQYGRECRALFRAPTGWVQIGADQEGLELRCLASDLALAGDEGAYAAIVLEGDVHTANQMAAGLPTRDAAKTFIYAFIYGGGDEKIGSIAGGGRAKGKLLRSTFLTKTPGLDKLIKAVKGAVRERGFIKGIDRRIIPVKSEHAALNYRLQNAGAVVCKQWGCDWNDQLQAAGLKHGWDGDYVFVSWSHDEYQVMCRDKPELIETIKQIGIKTGQEAGRPFSFQCRLDVGVKDGKSWAECH